MRAFQLLTTSSTIGCCNPSAALLCLNAEHGLAGDATPCQIYLDAQRTSIPIRSVVVAGGGRSRKG
jgi:hypothetical protein